MIPTAVPTAPATRRLSATASAHLDLIRGLAAAAVAFQHLRSFLLVDWPQASTHSPLAAGFYWLAKFAHPAVIVFFVLSGYLVGSSGIRSVENHTWSLGRYLLHRFLRLEIVLLPALLIGLLLDSAGIYLLHASALYNGGWHLIVRAGPIDLSGRVFVGNAAFVQNILVTTFGTNAALWSLSYEFWYYVLFGLITAALLRATRLWMRLVLIAFIFAAGWFVGGKILSLAPVWFLGLGIYFLPLLPLSARGRRYLLAFAALLVAAILEFTSGRANPVWAMMHPLLADLATGVCFGFLLYAILHANPARARYQQFAHRIAAPTYSLYANHLPAVVLLLACIGARSQPTALHCAEVTGWFVLLWLYGYGLYFLFESRTQAIRNWIEPRLFPVTQC